MSIDFQHHACVAAGRVRVEKNQSRLSALLNILASKKSLNVQVLERWKSGAESIGYACLWWVDVLMKSRDTFEPFCHMSSPGAPMWPKFALTHPTMDGITVKRLAVARIWQQARSAETNEQLGIAQDVGGACNDHADFLRQ
jgi:hypothetical protein